MRSLFRIVAAAVVQRGEVFKTPLRDEVAQRLRVCTDPLVTGLERRQLRRLAEKFGGREVKCIQRANRLNRTVRWIRRIETPPPWVRERGAPWHCGGVAHADGA